MADAQSYFLPSADIHPAIKKHNYDIGCYYGVGHEGSKTVEWRGLPVGRHPLHTSHLRLTEAGAALVVDYIKGVRGV